jgi:hypothetical protein
MPVPTRKAAVAAALLATVTAVAGCTQSSKPTKPTVHSSTSAKPSQGYEAVTTPPPGLPTGVKAATSIPASVPNSPSLRQNVDISTCKAVEGGWSAAGTASNPGSKQAGYTITVFFTTTSATVIDTVQTHVTVKPGDKQTWTASKKFTAPPKTLCVLRGVG